MFTSNLGANFAAMCVLASLLWRKTTAEWNASRSVGIELLTDVTDRIGLGDTCGTVIAVGDFNGDRYNDLLVVPNLNTQNAVRVLLWNHNVQEFQPSPVQDGHEQENLFDLSSLQSIPSTATISSATTLDADSDGILDVLLSVRISEDTFTGVLLRGNGRGHLYYDQILPGVPPGMLVFDANEDMNPDIFFISSDRERTFLLNNGHGNFRVKIWKPRGNDFDPCTPSFPFTSNAIVDINGDCLPDLVVSTSCGLEVWVNHGLEDKPKTKWFINQGIRKRPIDFSSLSLPEDRLYYRLLNSSVWNPLSDGRAVFSDFNGDGLNDIGAINIQTGELRISYGVASGASTHRSMQKGCPARHDWRFETYIAMRNVQIGDTKFGSSRYQGTFWVGDFNYDGRADILLLDGDTGTLSLYRAISQFSEQTWSSEAGIPHRLLDGLWFSVTGYRGQKAKREVDVIVYKNAKETILSGIEDPLGAAFFDLDESGRQYILIPQGHGTRLLQNNFRDMGDSLFFKAVTGSSVLTQRDSDGLSGQKVSPLSGVTVKLRYGGRYKKETHICTQCPQTGYLSLQTCSCLFGITRIANYIEEVAIGTGYGIRTWKNLMPNAIATIWLKKQPWTKAPRWKIAYLSKGRDGQVKKVVKALCATLIILFLVILYARGLEALEEPKTVTIGCT